VLPRHRVQALADLDVDVGADLAPRPLREHERGPRQRRQLLFLHRAEHRGRGGAVQRPAGPPAGDIGAPAHRCRLHLLQTGEFAAPPERVPDIRHRTLHLRLVTRLPGPGRVYQAAVVGGQLRIGPVDLRVIQVRPVHPGLEVVGDQPRRDSAEELERRHMALGPRPLIHLDHGPDEQQPRAAQHHREHVHRVPAPGPRIGPAPHLPVVDLGLLPGLGRLQPQHPHLRAAGLLRQVRRHIPAQRRHRHRQPALIGEPLVDRGHRHPGLQLPGDVIPVLPDRRPRHLPQPGISKLREPLPGQLRPLIPAHRRPARRHPGGLRRGHVLPHRVPRQPQAAGQLVLRPPRIPVHEDLADIDHVERPPRHRTPVPRRRHDPDFPMTRSTPTRTP
jgi:hypothetical protein